MLFTIITTYKKLYFYKKFSQELIKKGHKINFINIKKCYLKIKKKKIDIFYKKKKIKKIDILIPRISSNKKNYEDLHIIKEIEKKSKIIINNYLSIKNTNNKLLMLKKLSKNNFNIPKTIYIKKENNWPSIIKKNNIYPKIIKTLNNCQGKGVFYAKNKKECFNIIKKIFKNEKSILLQNYIKQKYIHDIRYIVFKKKILAVMKRIAKPGEYRSNIYQGGTAHKTYIIKKEKKIAISATKKLGLIFSSVDIIRNIYSKSILIEVNSSPGIFSIEKILKKNICKKIISTIIKYYRTKL